MWGLEGSARPSLLVLPQAAGETGPERWAGTKSHSELETEAKGESWGSSRTPFSSHLPSVRTACPKARGQTCWFLETLPSWRTMSRLSFPLTQPAGPEGQGQGESPFV